jgi:hypothetical protein
MSIFYCVSPPDCFEYSGFSMPQRYFSISKRIDENVSILIWVKGCYLYRFRCVFVFAFFRGQRKMDIQHQSNR